MPIVEVGTVPITFISSISRGSQVPWSQQSEKNILLLSAHFYQPRPGYLVTLCSLHLLVRNARSMATSPRGLRGPRLICRTLDYPKVGAHIAGARLRTLPMSRGTVLQYISTDSSRTCNTSTLTCFLATLSMGGQKRCQLTLRLPSGVMYLSLTISKTTPPLAMQ